MAPQRALFLDRDGVINLDKGYLYQHDDIEWVPGIISLMRRFQQAGYLLVVITNQSGIGRGYYTEKDFFNLTEWMNAELFTQGVKIDDVFYCPHHPKQGVGKYKIECDCRKPRPGMLLKAIEKWHISAEHSVFIGDSWRDIEAGEQAGLGRLLYFSNAVSKDHQAQIEKRSGLISVVSDLADIEPKSTTP